MPKRFLHKLGCYIKYVVTNYQVSNISREEKKEKKMQNLADMSWAFWAGIRIHRSQEHTSPMGRSANPVHDLHPFLHLRARESVLAPHSYTLQLSKHIYHSNVCFFNYVGHCIFVSFFHFNRHTLNINFSFTR